MSEVSHINKDSSQLLFAGCIITQQRNSHPLHFSGIHSLSRQSEQSGRLSQEHSCPKGTGNRLFQSNMACFFMIWRQIPVSVLKRIFWQVPLLFRGELTSTTISLKGQEFKWYVIYQKKGKKSSTACQTSRNVCGIILLLLSYMWLKRRGCFLRTFTRGAGLWWDK